MVVEDDVDDEGVRESLSARTLSLSSLAAEDDEEIGVFLGESLPSPRNALRPLPKVLSGDPDVDVAAVEEDALDEFDANDVTELPEVDRDEPPDVEGR